MNALIVCALLTLAYPVINGLDCFHCVNQGDAQYKEPYSDKCGYGISSSDTTFIKPNCTTCVLAKIRQIQTGKATIDVTIRQCFGGVDPITITSANPTPGASGTCRKDNSNVIGRQADTTNCYCSDKNLCNSGITRSATWFVILAALFIGIFH